MRQVIESGAIAGYPMEGIRVTVYDGKYHSVDSKEVAFVAAGKKAFLDAVGKARPTILEPIVNLQIIAPNAHMGDITGDIAGKRGRISGTTALAGGKVSISGQLPLAEMENYQSTLKSITGGEGSYTMEFSHYEPAPQAVQKALTSAFADHDEE